MKTLRNLSAIASLLVCFPGAAAIVAEGGVEGRWDGVILVQPAEVEVDFSVVLARDEKGFLTGRVSFPTQGPTEYPFTSLEIEGDQIAFSSQDGGGVVASYAGTLSPGRDSVAGDITEQGVTKPFVLRKTSAAPGSDATPQAPPLHVLSTGGRELMERFNEDAGTVRLVIVLAPNCGMCRMGARMVQRHVLETIDDPRLRVYVIWEPASSREDEQAARAAASFITGDRVTHFWSAERFTGKAFQNVVAPQKDPVWDVFLLYDEAKRWGAEGPPAPDAFMHNLRERQDLPKDRYLNLEKLAAEVKALLG